MQPVRTFVFSTLRVSVFCIFALHFFKYLTLKSTYMKQTVPGLK